jgi:SNF2 family DNA or RNA helicase
MVRGLREGSTVEGSLPGPFFQGELLMHQQKGLDWLLFLYRHRFSALLADEMGLGKTVQVLAFFSCLRTNLPVLIAAPTSLIYNWRSEMSRFLPSFPVYLHMGADRLSQVSDLKEHRFIITSYAILRLDEELLSQVEWEVIVLDESGAIKTAATQTARAAYGLKSRFRICLNGTPVENRSDELWSQFRFLLPHLTPTARTIKPFILRRKKDELDLPEKIEQTVWISMSDAQSALYDSYLKGVQTNLLKKETLNRMEILEAILRLRQICVDPRLLGSKDPGEKLERVLADIEEALFEKRKVLIYSQFTSALQLLSKQLSCNFLYLDGTTAPAQRADLVRRFQEDPEASLFLLSLKAGGVGLNLTAADYVFLLDPWWNDAVENQAIDRAHRIGRKKSVMARRYLTVGTIEEKMLSLKEKKLTIAAALLDEEVSWTEEDWLHLLS